jgi:hypothetical protein
MLALACSSEPVPLRAPVFGSRTREPCCSSADRVLRATRAFSLSGVSHFVESELNCTPIEVIF